LLPYGGIPLQVIDTPASKIKEITEFKMITVALQTYFNNLTTATHGTGQRPIVKNQSTQGTLLQPSRTKQLRALRSNVFWFDQIYRKNIQIYTYHLEYTFL